MLEKHNKFIKDFYMGVHDIKKYQNACRSIYIVTKQSKNKSKTYNTFRKKFY